MCCGVERALTTPAADDGREGRIAADSACGTVFITPSSVRVPMPRSSFGDDARWMMRFVPTGSSSAARRLPTTTDDASRSRSRARRCHVDRLRARRLCCGVVSCWVCLAVNLLTLIRVVVIMRLLSLFVYIMGLNLPFWRSMSLLYWAVLRFAFLGFLCMYKYDQSAYTCVLLALQCNILSLSYDLHIHIYQPTLLFVSFFSDI
jgi:hypothetical protein